MKSKKKVYWILSGEGELGTWTRHYVTPRGIKRIATRERCGGDRWAKVFVEVPETWTSQAHLIDIVTGDTREVPEL